MLIFMLKYIEINHIVDKNSVCERGNMYDL
nr:MAG TPA: hypothetical protein [Caudoviricetes sp.]